MVKTRKTNPGFYIDRHGVHRYYISDDICTDQERLSDDEDSVAAEDTNEEHSDSDEDLLEVEPPIHSKTAKKNRNVTARKRTTASLPKSSASSRKTTSSRNKNPPSESDSSPVSTGFNSQKENRRQQAAVTMKTSSKTKQKGQKKSDSNKKRQVEDDDPPSDDDDGVDDLEENGQTEDERHMANLTAAILANKSFANQLLAQAREGNALQLSSVASVDKKTKSLSRKKQKIKGSGNHLSLASFVKKVTKLQFRHTKFTRTEKEMRKRVGDPTMDALEISSLHHRPGETRDQAANVEANRDRFFQEWSGVMAGAMNEVRNYRQGRVKDACIEKWMVPNKKTKLFPTEDLIIVMKRDFSKWEPKMDDDGNTVEDGDPDKLAHYHELFDWYVDILLPAMCGSNDLIGKIRHFEPVSTARYGENAGDSLVGKIICPPSQEAMVLLYFENARKKWEMMYDWKVVQGKTSSKTDPFPQWSPKKPDVNKEWKTVYSNAHSGQDPFGGWKKKGISRFNEISRMMKQVREEPNSLVQEKLACQRLYQKHKDDYANTASTKPEDSDDEIDLDEEEMEFDDDK
jgi:hypothetical protein